MTTADKPISKSNGKINHENQQRNYYRNSHAFGCRNFGSHDVFQQVEPRRGALVEGGGGGE